MQHLPDSKAPTCAKPYQKAGSNACKTLPDSRAPACAKPHQTAGLTPTRQQGSNVCETLPDSRDAQVRQRQHAYQTAKTRASTEGTPAVQRNGSTPPRFEIIWDVGKETSQMAGKKHTLSGQAEDPRKYQTARDNPTRQQECEHISG